MTVGEAFAAVAAWFLSLRLVTAVPVLALAALSVFGLGFAVAALRRVLGGLRIDGTPSRAAVIDLVAGVLCAAMAGWGLAVYV